MVLPLIFVLFSLFFPGSHRFPSEKKNVSSSTTRMLSAVKTSRTKGESKVGAEKVGAENHSLPSEQQRWAAALGITLLQLHHTGGRGPFTGPLLLDPDDGPTRPTVQSFMAVILLFIDNSDVSSKVIFIVSSSQQVSSFC